MKRDSWKAFSVLMIGIFAGMSFIPMEFLFNGNVFEGTVRMAWVIAIPVGVLGGFVSFIWSTRLPEEGASFWGLKERGK